MIAYRAKCQFLITAIIYAVNDLPQVYFPTTAATPPPGTDTANISHAVPQLFFIICLFSPGVDISKHQSGTRAQCDFVSGKRKAINHVGRCTDSNKVILIAFIRGQYLIIVTEPSKYELFISLVSPQ